MRQPEIVKKSLIFRVLKKLSFFTQIGHFWAQICTKVYDLATYEAPCLNILPARTTFEFVPVAQNFCSALWQPRFVTSPASAVDRSIR